MEKTPFLTVIVALFLSSHPANAIYVTVDPSPQQYRNQPILLDVNKVIGKVGDYFELQDGAHALRIAAPNKHYIQMMVTVKDDSMKIRIERGQSLNGCMETWITEWKGQLETKRTRIRQGVLWVISLPEIRFIRALGQESCAFYAYIACPRSSYFVTVITDPSNAEIWVDDEMMDRRTPTPRLRASFCQWQPSVHIVTRAPGYVNCAKEFELVPGAVVVFRCKMERIQFLSDIER